MFYLILYEIIHVESLGEIKMICKVEKVKPGSVVCDAQDPKQLYRVIEHLTVFDGFDIGNSMNAIFGYGETKRICRMKLIENDRIYRYPSTKKVIFVEGPQSKLEK